MGPEFFLVIKPNKSKSVYEMAESLFAQSRNLVGSALIQVSSLSQKYDLTIHIHGYKKQVDKISEGVSVGLELGSYRFDAFKKNKAQLPEQVFFKASKKIHESHLGWSVNMARHLVNLPANELHPASYTQFVKKIFAGRPGVKINVLTEKEILKEGLNLLANVGQAAVHTSRLVHLKYRPKGAKIRQ